MSNNKRIEILGVPMDLGANIKGTAMGPAVLRSLGLITRIKELGYNVVDQGDVYVPKDAYLNKVENIAEICGNIKERVLSILSNDGFPLLLGGDHSLSIGSVSGVLSHAEKHGQKFGLIWIDAHADFNTQTTSQSGNIHGMPLSVLVSEGDALLTRLVSAHTNLSRQNIVIIGLRSVDSLEKERLFSSGICYFTVRDIDKRGIHSVITEAIARASDGTSGIHCSFDVDALDPFIAGGVSAPAMGGLLFREVRYLLEALFDTKLLRSMDVVEINPVLDVHGKTAEVAIELIVSAFGGTII